MMTGQQATAWVKQELAKIDTAEKAAAHLASYENSKAFFASEAGQASAKRDPQARHARHELAAAVARKVFA